MFRQTEHFSSALRSADAIADSKRETKLKVSDTGEECGWGRGDILLHRVSLDEYYRTRRSEYRREKISFAVVMIILPPNIRREKEGKTDVEKH